MKGELTLKILEAIAAETENAVDLVRAILRAGYGASMRGIDYQLDRIQMEKDRSKALAAKNQKIQQRLNDFLYRLKKDGLIEERQRRNGKFLKLTARGFFKIKLLRDRKIANGHLFRRKYKKEKGGQLILITFDIPEKYRMKRAWLRFSLKNLGFTMLQQSVWVGRVKLPREFINDLKNNNLFQFVEILAITKTGSMKQID
jgi:DNA-binding transcriptional ArsR family regulator